MLQFCAVCEPNNTSHRKPNDEPNYFAFTESHSISINIANLDSIREPYQHPKCVTNGSAHSMAGNRERVFRRPAASPILQVSL